MGARTVAAVTWAAIAGCTVSPPGPGAEEPSESREPEPIAGLPAVEPDDPEPTESGDAPASSSDPKQLPSVNHYDPDTLASSSPKPGEKPPRPWSEEELARILKVQKIVAAAAQEFGVDPYLINGFIWVESKFKNKAKGPAGAQGIMQIMPRTAKGHGKKMGERPKPWNTTWNIRAGTFGISRLLKRFDGNVTLAIAAYNRGAGRVSGWLRDGEPIPERTLHYVDKVLRARDRFVEAAKQGIVPTPPMPAEVASADEPVQGKTAEETPKAGSSDAGERPEPGASKAAPNTSPR